MLSAGPHYEAFVTAVELGTITAASARLGLPRPTVSRYLARLESDLGVALLHRTTRRITTTAAGQRLYERIRPLLDDWAAIEADVRADAHAVVGTVRVSVLPLLTVPMAAVVKHLQAAHPRLAVEVVANVRLVDLRSEGFDAAIWAGDPRDPDLVTRTLAAGGVSLVASPAYLAARGTPQRVADLADHDLLRGHSGSGRPRVWWPLVDGGRFKVDGRFVTNDAALLREAALQGQGIALLSDLNSGPAFAQGRLVRVLPGIVGVTAAVRLIVARRTLLPLRVRVFMDAVVDHFDVRDER
ncbi:MAG: LysR family transcriptional regulator [Alphaproteobacteria bacterium]|nr:LysR family transcriptional regulator [Alphaproteobacteria bacterium]